MLQVALGLLLRERRIIDHLYEYKVCGRIKSDAEDRRKIRKFLKNCIHPFEFNKKSSSLFFNIYTGETAGGKCNVNKSVEIGVQQMNQFKESLPLGFRNKLLTKLVTMAQIAKTDKEEI